ncbi:MAG TPA: choice-of-anchor Q domain-containing protein, partial [Bdellovibrionales bacterium]|nr:choice-of-anchor Q domain-containing protein [Bdellovibrionales bacterium]
VVFAQKNSDGPTSVTKRVVVSSATPTPTPKPTATPVPPATPAPTPKPTATPVPPATPTPTPAPTRTPAGTSVSTAAQLTAAFSAAKGGETIILKSGNYGAVTLSGKSFSSAVKIVSEVQAGAKFTSLILRQVDNVLLQSVRVDMTQVGDNYGLQVLDSANITVRSNVLYAVDFNGGKNIYMNNVRNVLVEANDISTTNDGVHTNGYLENVTFKGNSIMHRHDVIPVGAHADTFQFRSGPVNGLKILGNVYGYAHQNVFQQNIGTGPWKNIEISGNVSLTKGTGLSGKHVFLSTVENVVVEGNTFASTTPGGYSQGIVATVSGTFVVRNNIFYNAMYVNFGKVSNYNLFYADVKPAFSGYGSLSALQAGTGQDKNSAVADPKFVNLAAENVRLQSSSPAINKGAALAIEPIDIYGTARPRGGAWDIGAVEY